MRPGLVFQSRFSPLKKRTSTYGNEDPFYIYIIHISLPSAQLLLDRIVSKASFGVRNVFYNRDWLGVIGRTALFVHSLSADSPVRKTLRTVKAESYVEEGFVSSLPMSHGRLNRKERAVVTFKL